jgi:hypothetical protein
MWRTGKKGKENRREWNECDKKDDYQSDRHIAAWP